MYGNNWTTGGTVAGGGVLAATGAPTLGWVILLGVALLVTGFVLLRNNRLKTANRRSPGR
ncbi:MULTISPECIES: hypothetical protein [Arthrobacter]|uniref:LPXTG-motif cell wall anchor domain-containing protein n=2 Tax=Arthrobacter TaxID=1663 RepID=A0ABU9KLC7_9MICC|nr:hypothetical protein [Arthrobacter sp. YJM1]MDP5227709.1 hypothetical protein [Arthrobacter sp. YJM1]